MNRLRLCARSLLSLRPVNYEGQRYAKAWVSATQKEITRRKRRLSGQIPQKRSNFLEWNRQAELYAFNQRLSEKFQPEKLEQAFTHRSYIFQQEQNQKKLGIEEPEITIPHNEELITMGMQLTSEVVMKYLIQSLPRVPDAGIMVFHDYLMSKEILAKASVHIGTKDIILTAEYPVVEETLANTFLALVAALAESADVDRASTFVRDFLIAGLADKDLTEIWSPSEPLSVLNNILSQQKRGPAEPRIIAQTGINTLVSVYRIGMYSDKQFLGSGFGQTIEEATTAAATEALCRMFGLLDSDQPLRFDRTIEMS